MIETEEFASFIDDEIERTHDLFVKKYLQYSTSLDPLSNFRTGALLEHHDGSYEKMYEVAKGYLNKHIAFLYDHGIADKTEESLHPVGRTFNLKFFAQFYAEHFSYLRN